MMEAEKLPLELAEQWKVGKEDRPQEMGTQIREFDVRRLSWS
jgi:hypothetical protein